MVNKKSSYRANLSHFVQKILNASLAGHSSVQVIDKKFFRALLALLETEGYIRGVRQSSDDGFLEVDLKYSDNSPVLQELSLVSKPSKRVYWKANQIRACYNGMGTYILSTSHSLLTDKAARSAGVGGEVLLMVF